MKCTHCKDTRKYKQPNNKERFEKLIDIEMEKSYFVNYDMAEEKAYKEVGFTIIDCPFCNNKKSQFQVLCKPSLWCRIEIH